MDENCIELINKKIKDLSFKEKEEIKLFLIQVFKDNLNYKNHVYANPDLNECLLLYRENKLIGHIDVTKRIINYKNKQYLIGGIGDVAIDKNYRKNGFGNKMMKKINEILKEEKYNLGVLFCHPKLDNFYSSCGWIPKDNGKIFATVNGILKDQMRTFLLPIELTEEDIKIWNNEDINIGNGSW